MESPFTEESVVIDTEGQTLEGILAYPSEGVPVTAVLLLSPHPQLGGNMDNNVIRHIARRSAEEGCLSLRFNYRGVGASGIDLPPNTGVFDYWAELEEKRAYEELVSDCASAQAFLSSATSPSLHQVHVGYSLGAILAGMAPHSRSTQAVVGIAPPTTRTDLSAYHHCQSPKYFITGDEDFAFSQASFLEGYQSLSEPKSHIPLPGCDHFFRRAEERVFEAIRPILLGRGKVATK